MNHAQNPIAGRKISLQDSDNLPLVTVVIPTLNESDHIVQCLESLEHQTWPANRLEVLVVDAFSNDGTREKVDEFAKQSDLSIRLLDNPGRIQSRAVNVGIEHASGDVFVRMDAHGVYNPEYIETAVRRLAENGEIWNVGGFCITRPADDSDLAFAMARAFANPFGGGDAVYRTGRPEREKFVDTVVNGAYPISVFDELGHYDPNVWMGEDMEFNSRILARGKKILITPGMQVQYYYKPKNFRDLWHRYYSHGEWLFRRKGGRAWRHFVPLIFFLYLLAGPILVVTCPMTAVLWGMGMMVYFIAAAWFTLKYEGRNLTPQRFILMIASFFVMHLAFGAGALVSLFKYAGRPAPPVE